ncbi:MAG: hydroxyacid-oxoacid transhydrogenase [Thermomicrobiales bacterium]
MAAHETIFSMDTSSIKFGPGSTSEVGYEMRRLGARRVLVVTDPGLADSQAVATTVKAIRSEGIDVVIFDNARVEPTDASFKEAIAVAVDGEFDGYVAVGGGSAMDTAKAANLYATYPADFLTYVNPPIGDGAPVPGPLKPLIAIPTTAGTGSETTGVAIFDYTELHAKTGIAHRSLRPALGIVDPENTRTLPPLAAACSGFDVLCHAIESITAIPYNSRDAADSPALRPSYQGSNPISDIWAAESLRMCAANIVRAVEHPEDDVARSQMMLAATYAGIGFGNAGCHLPHGMSYPVSGMVRDFWPEGYSVDHPLIPHGMSVILNAPAVFRWTAEVSPERHLWAAELLGADTSGVDPEDAGEILANAIIELMRKVDMPNGLAAVGFEADDIPALVEGTMPQHRVTKLSPRPAGPDDLSEIFRNAMRYW